MTAEPKLKVTTHVGRDLLASAAIFKTEASVVWGYVVNSLQYVDPGMSPRVQVQIRPTRREIVISDNGKGMNAEDLNHFFRMHGENLDRLAGRTGRGKWGTGKSAAFGIANVLQVDTIRQGKRNVVSLTRKMIQNSGGKDIPLSWEIRDEETDEPNGTVVLIGEINFKIKRAPVIEYIERHLQASEDRQVDMSRAQAAEAEMALESRSERVVQLGDIEEGRQGEPQHPGHHEPEDRRVEESAADGSRLVGGHH